MKEQQAGLLPGLELRDFGVAEREITNNLGTVWFVSHAGRQQNGPKPTSYLYLKPTEVLREQFNFRHELLCIFHPYDSIDARFLKTIESILARDPARLDGLCVVTITNATSIEATAIPALQDSDQRVLIHFNYRELKGGAGPKIALTKDRLEKQLYTKDLFSMSSALKTDRYFFGRGAELQKLVGHYEAGENASVFGLRRIGKTSILWAVARELRRHDAPVAFIDCSDPTYYKATWFQALFRIKDLAFKSSGMRTPGHLQSEYTETNASTCFREDLEAIRQAKLKPTLLIFDEIENLCFDLSPSLGWKSGENYLPFWQAIRATYQQSTNLFNFLLCGVNPQILETARLPDGIDNPIYRYVAPNYLGFFDEQDVRAMLTRIGSYMGMTFDNEVFTYLTDDFGGHPFLIRQACSQLRKKLVSELIPQRLHIQKETYRNHFTELSLHTRGYITLILQVLTDRYSPEYALLKHIAADDHDLVEQVEQQSPHLVEHLLGYGLVKKVGKRYHFRIGQVKAAVEQDARDLVCPAAVEERWAYLSRERNNFERLLKELMRTVLKVTLGPAEAKNQVLAVMSKPSQKEKCTALGYDDIYGPKGELYLLDLRTLVIRHWDKFSHVFDNDKPKFSSSMEIVNKYRADAHAKTITKDQFREAMPRAVWISNMLATNA